MLLTIAVIVTLVLLAVVLLPAKKRDSVPQPAAVFRTPEPVKRAATLREQQVQEEASAIAGEYQRRADQAWLTDLTSRAATLLTPEKK